MKTLIALWAGTAAFAAAWAMAGTEEKPRAPQTDPARCPEPQPDPWEHHRGRLAFVVGFDEGMKAARDTGRPPMLFFTTTWCGWCKKLASEAFTDDEVVKSLGKFTAILVDADREPKTAQRYGAQGVPYVVFADAGGRVVSRVEGYVPKNEFLVAAQNAARLVPEGKPSKEYLEVFAASRAIDEALAAKDVRAAFSAIARVEKMAHPGPELEKAKAAKEKLLAAGRERLAALRKAAETDPVATRRDVDALAAEYSGTCLAPDIEDFAKSLRPASK
jgi:thioredoxin-like negative regulator of GroEL